MTTKYIDRENIESRIALADSLLEKHNLSTDIFDSYLTEDMVRSNIENFIGAIAIPLGLCGPIDIHGQYARGEFVAPMATQEGTLVASYSRGCRIINKCGGCEAMVYNDYFLRGIQFKTASLKKSAELIKWCESREAQIDVLINKSGNYIKLVTRTSLESLNEFTQNYKNMLASHGCYSLNIHAANGMAALFQALGQDMAYIGECSQVIADSYFIDADHLEFTVTLPTLIIGTVGAGTGLPACKAAFSIMDCHGKGKTKKLAEIIASVVLAGEIGCASALCASEFIQSHEAMGKNYPAM